MTTTTIAKANRGASRRPWKPTPVALALLFPALFVLSFFILVPSVQLLWLSFTNYVPGRGGEFVGIENYLWILADPGFQSALLRNIFYVLAVVGLEVTIGFSCALVLQQKFPLRALWMALLIAPFAVSPIVAVVMWKYMLDPSFGLVNYILTTVGLPPVRWLSSPATSMAAIILVSVWKDFSFTTIVMFAALTSVPRELYEAARIDGASALQTLRQVTLPLILPAFAVVILFRTIFTIREFGVPWTMTGGGPGTSTEILSLYLYKEAFRYSNFGAGAATGWIILVVTVIFSSFLIRRTYRGMYKEPVR